MCAPLVCVRLRVCVRGSLSINGRRQSVGVITARGVRRCLACQCAVASLWLSAMSAFTTRRRRATRGLPATLQGLGVMVLTTSVCIHLRVSAAWRRWACTISGGYQ